TLTRLPSAPTSGTTSWRGSLKAGHGEAARSVAAPREGAGPGDALDQPVVPAEAREQAEGPLLPSGRGRGIRAPPPVLLQVQHDQRKGVSADGLHQIARRIEARALQVGQVHGMQVGALAGEVPVEIVVGDEDLSGCGPQTGDQGIARGSI